MRRLRTVLWRYRELVALWMLAAALVVAQMAGPKAWTGGLPLVPTGPPPPTSQQGVPTWPATSGPTPPPSRPEPPATTLTTSTTLPGPVGVAPPPSTATTLPPVATMLPPLPTVPTVTLPPTTLGIEAPTTTTLTTLPPAPATTACLRPGPPDPPPVTWQGPSLTATTVGQKHDRCRPTH